MLEFLDTNKEWLFSGGGVVLVAAVVGLLWKRSQAKVEPPSISQNQKGGDHSTNIQVGSGSVTTGERPKK